MLDTLGLASAVGREQATLRALIADLEARVDAIGQRAHGEQRALSALDAQLVGWAG